jgi:hypothetical protein
MPGEYPDDGTPDPGESAANRVKEAYMLYRNAIHPNWRPAIRWEKCWRTVAKLLNENGWDPDTYICVQFQSTTPFPHPNMLYSKTAIGHMTRAIAERAPASEADTKATAETSFWVSRINVFRDPAQVLGMAARNPSISAIFLYCAARQCGLDGSRWIAKTVETMRMTPIADAYRRARLLTPEIEAEITQWILRQHPK